jgi:hypothetical protein
VEAPLTDARKRVPFGRALVPAFVPGPGEPLAESQPECSSVSGVKVAGGHREATLGALEVGRQRAIVIDRVGGDSAVSHAADTSCDELRR